MKQVPEIPEAQWRVMEIIWEKAPVASSEVVRELKSNTKWKDTTVYTLIRRLSEKGLIRIEKAGALQFCTPLVSREECSRRERSSFLKKVYSGSLNLMLANMIDGGELTDAEIQELRDILKKREP